MTESKGKLGNVGSVASKIAQSNKAAKEAEAELAKQKEAEEAEQQANQDGSQGQAGENGPSGNDDIRVGATVAGSMMSNAQGPAGVPKHKRAPGYYSRHAGKVRIGQKQWKWPMEAPLVPKEDETELKAYLDSMVERGLATLVE